MLLQDGGIFIRPIRDTEGSEFSEQILAFIFAEGFSGSELLEKFKQQSKKIRLAVQRLI